MQITNPVLIELIRRKVKLNQPYCGIFLKRDEENESEVVKNLNDVYSIGVFAQIHEMQDLGDRLRLVVMAHRRIKITGQIFDAEQEVPKGKICKKNIFENKPVRLLAWFLSFRNDFKVSTFKNINDHICRGNRGKGKT